MLSVQTDEEDMRGEHLAFLEPEDQQAAHELAAMLNVSPHDLVREFTEEWEKLTPEEQAAFGRIIDRANEVLPAIAASIDHIEANLARCNSMVRELREQAEAMSNRVSRIEESILDSLLIQLNR